MTNIDPVDGWTLVHVAAGMAGAAVGWGPWTMAGLGVAWELLERPLEGLELLEPEAVGNVAVDLAAMAIGYYAYKAWSTE